MKYKLVSVLLTISAVMIASTPLASAHVIVTPQTAEPARETIFSISAPDEKDVPMTSLRLVLPAGLHDVMPTAQAGWTVTTEKSGDNLSSITWADGNLPGGQRADFSFQAQTPEKTGEVQWKAYQTFADGSAISWDQKPSATPEGGETENSGPYSVTGVRTPAANKPAQSGSGIASTTALGLSLLALLLSVFMLIRSKKSSRG